MEEEFKERLKESLEELLQQFSINLSKAVISKSLGLDYGMSEGELFNDVLEGLESLIGEIVNEIKSADGVQEILDMWSLFGELGMLMGNFKMWMTCSDTSSNDLERFTGLLNDLKGSLEKFHNVLEKVQEQADS